MTTTVAIDSHLQSKQDADSVRCLFVQAAETAHATFINLAERLTRGGCCQVHVLLGGFGANDFVYVGRLGSPKKVDSARGVYPGIAKKRAEMQVQNKTAVASYVPSDYEGLYPQLPGSAWCAGVSVGVASDRPEVDEKIAGVFAQLVYDAWSEAMAAHGFDKR